MWRKTPILAFAVSLLALWPAFAKDDRFAFIRTSLTQKGVKAVDSPVIWGGELTITSPKIWEAFKKRKAEGASDKDTISDPANAEERDRLVAAMLSRCPGCVRRQNLDYSSKIGQLAKVIEIGDEWTLSVAVDPAVLEAHITPATLALWRERKDVLERVWFDTARMNSFTLGTLSGNGHLTRDITTGFDNDSLWMRNAIVHHWNHPALADRVFDAESTNAVTMPRLKKELRERRLKWLSLIDSDFIFYVEALEDALSKPELDLNSILGALGLKPGLQHITNSYQTHMRGTHDEPLNLEHNDRWEFRGFLNQTSADQMFSQMIYLENGIQNIRGVDGLIAFNNGLVTHPNYSREESLRQFLNYGQGLPLDQLKKVLPGRLKPVFETEKHKPRSQIRLKAAGLRSREAQALSRLAERITQMMETEVSLAGQAATEDLNDRAARLNLLISTAWSFEDLVPLAAKRRLEERWSRLYGALREELTRLPPTNERRQTLIHGDAVLLAWGPLKLGPLYWDALAGEDIWSKRAQALLEKNPPPKDHTARLLLHWLIEYRKEKGGKIDATDFDEWLLSPVRLEEFLKTSNKFDEGLSDLNRFLVEKDVADPKSPTWFLQGYLKERAEKKIELISSQAYRVLELPFASGQIKASVWPLYSQANWYNFKEAVRRFGLQFHLLDTMTRAKLLGDEQIDSAGELAKWRNPVECKRVYDELEAMLEEQMKKTGAASPKVRELLLYQLNLPFLGRAALLKLWANEENFEPAQISREFVAKGFMKVLESGELSSLERLKIFEHYFTTLREDRVSDLEHQRLRYCQEFWGLLKDGEFLEHRGRWKTYTREVAHPILDPRYPLKPQRAWAQVGGLRPAVFRKAEMLERWVGPVEDLLADCGGSSIQDSTPTPLLSDQLDYLESIESSDNIRHFSNRVWRAFAGLIVHGNRSIHISPKKIPRSFWRIFTMEIEGLMSRQKSSEWLATRLQQAATNLAHSFVDREKLLFPDRFLALIQSALERAVHSGARAEASSVASPKVIRSLLLFLDSAQEVPAKLKALRAEWEEIRAVGSAGTSRTGASEDCQGVLVNLLNSRVQ